ncbi:FecR family protein [Asticcacaulis sp. W401b]|uniref:FecR family protein n=1 Tax=Asticcacaulis sp. W401b TaxID=3388666 RepID=UPI0039708501
MTDDIATDEDRLNEAAALWHSRLEAGTASLDAFNTWRDADPRHSLAFALVQATADAIDDLRQYDFKDDPDLRVGNGVIRRRLIRTAIPVLGLALCAGAWVFSQRRALASTGVGERRFIALPDRMSMELNTDTRVEWKRMDGMVRLWLLRGEVAVSVPAGQGPCVLETPSATAEISGDANARLRAYALDLTVLRGACIVKGHTKASPQRLQPQQSILAGAGEAKVRGLTSEEAKAATAWRSDTLEFGGQPLAYVVDEYNRYLHRKMIIVDPEIAAISVGGRFSSQDPEGFLRMVQSSFGVRVTTSPDGQILLTRQDRRG